MRASILLAILGALGCSSNQGGSAARPADAGGPRAPLAVDAGPAAPATAPAVAPPRAGAPASAPASRASAGTGPSAAVSDPVREELQRLGPKLKAEMTAALAAARSGYTKGHTPGDRSEALKRGSLLARRVAAGLGEFDARDAELRQLLKGASAAWRGYADAIDRLNAEGSAATPDPKRLGDANEAVTAARGKVTEAMKKLGELAARHGT